MPGIARLCRLRSGLADLPCLVCKVHDEARAVARLSPTLHCRRGDPNVHSQAAWVVDKLRRIY